MYLRHPLSAAFPSMSDEELDALIDDIDANGQREPVMLFEGMVLDGWHRYLACETLEIATVVSELPAYLDPRAYVISQNRHRRHLTPSQMAAAVVACNEWATPSDNQFSKRAGDTVSPALTVPEMAKQAGVSERTIQRAKTAHEAGLGDAVRDEIGRAHV